MLYDSFRSNPKINAILNSEQFPYSEQIIEFRIKNELNIERICNFLEITPEEYISALEKLNQILNWVSGFFFIPFRTQLNATVGTTPIV